MTQIDNADDTDQNAGGRRRGQPPHQLGSRCHRPSNWCGGQYTLEWAVMFMAVIAALALMVNYVRDAMRAGVKSTEMQLNSAMRDNRPID